MRRRRRKLSPLYIFFASVMKILNNKRVRKWINKKLKRRKKKAGRK